MDDPQSARTVASGEVFWPPWSEGQDRQLDREIYDALSAGGITNFRNHIKHNFGHDEGVSGLESWDVVVHIAEITTAGVIVQYVLPQLIRILKPGGHLPEAEASSVDKEELSLEEARAIATEQVRSSSQLLNIDDPPITENLAMPLDDGHYVFSYVVSHDAYTVFVSRNGGARLVMRSSLDARADPSE